MDESIMACRHLAQFFELYDKDEITYEKERMYWLGYCLQ